MSSGPILIVEDEQSFAGVVENLLQSMGYAVAGIAQSGEDALRLAETSRPSLALMDIEIQGAMDGFDVAERLRQRYDLPIIFLTGHADDATVERVRRSESFGYLLKPFRQEELKAAMELALIRHGHEAHLKNISHAFTAAFKSIEEAVILVNNDGKITYLNPAAERLTGWSAARGIGQSLLTVVSLHPSEDSGVDAILRSAAHGAFVHAGTLINTAGHLIPVEISAAVVNDEVQGRTGSVLILRDLTDREPCLAARTRPQADSQLRSGRIDACREADHAGSTTEAHDEFGRLLLKLKTELAWLEEELPMQTGLTKPAPLDRVRTMTELVANLEQCLKRNPS